MSATRWGLVSAGQICQDFTTALQLLPSEQHQVVAVAARKISDAQKFADRFKIPRAYGSYADLAADPDIDVVYIGTVHPFHAEVSKLMLNSNKAVLCEKPVTMNSRELRDVVKLAKEKTCFFMEGFWSRFFPAYTRLREVIQAGDIGEPTVINISFSFTFPTRVYQKELGHGTTLDIACYVVQLANLIFRGEPEQITASADLTPNGCDLTTSVILKYPGGKMATFVCSEVCQSPNTAYIQGTKGFIKLPKIWCPDKIEINGKEEDFPLPECEQKMIFPNSQGFVYEAQHVRECLLKGQLESTVMPLADSLTVMGILDEIRKQIGVHYVADEV